MTIKSKKETHLTNSEEDLMTLFWEKQEPLTSAEILELSSDRSWNGNYVHMMLRSLLKKGMIEVCGSVQYGAQYARQFQPVVTREQYAARLVMSKGIEKSAIADVAVAMASEAGAGGEELIGQLEEMIRELKSRQKEEN